MQGLVSRMKQHYDSCTHTHKVVPMTTYTAPAVIHVPGLVKCAASLIPLEQIKVQKRHAVEVIKEPSTYKLHAFN